MPYGRPANVRSHRRSRARRRGRIVAPWITFVTVAVFVLAAAGTGYAYLVRKPCSGEINVTVAASPLLSKTLDSLNRSWAATSPSVNGKCVVVDVEEKDSAVVAQALGASWDTKINGPAPDVWVPESSVWVREASANNEAERMMPDLQPSLARSPAVMAMPRDMALAMGWPKVNLSWASFIRTIDWSAYHNSQWGQFKLGMANPVNSTASMLALIAMLDTSDDGEITPDEQQNLFTIKSVMKAYDDDTSQLLASMASREASGKNAVLGYLSGFPALEQDVVNYNSDNPPEPLVAVYPTDGSADADNPYLVLDAPWSNPVRQAAARLFLQYLRGPHGRQAFLDEGLRDPNRVGGSTLTQANGVEPVVPTLPRAIMLPQSVQSALETWTGVTRPTNMLLVIDISGSMNTPVPGTGKTRLQLAKAAAASAVATFSADARIGLWAFSTNQGPDNRDYREVVPLGPLGDRTASGDTRKTALINGINGLSAGGDTGLYTTVAAAQQDVLNNYQAGDANFVVVISDGKNDNPNGGLSLDQLAAKLKQGDAGKKQVKVITIAYGADADTNALSQIAFSSGGELLTSRNAFDINQVLSAAMLGRTS